MSCAGSAALKPRAEKDSGLGVGVKVTKDLQFAAEKEVGRMQPVKEKVRSYE